LLALGAFFATVSINTIISEQQQQLQPEIQNQAELEALTQFLAGIGIVIGAIILAVGIGVLSKKCAARYSLFALFLLEISTI
jgi:hypothetical protein